MKNLPFASLYKITLSIVAVCSTALLIAPSSTFAQAPAAITQTTVLPEQIVTNIYNQLTTRAKNDVNLAKSPARVVRTIEEDIAPHVDVESVARKLIGKHWTSASSAQQQALIAETKKLLVRQYQSIFPAMLEFLRTSKFDVKKAKFMPGDTQTTVKSVFIRNNKPLELNYKFKLGSDNQWRFVDVGVGGPWLTDILKDTVRDTFEKQGGIDGVIKYLKERNNRSLDEEEKERQAKAANALNG